MKFETFIKKHDISLNKKIQSLCLEGLVFMQKSKDAMHDKKHIEEIFSNLDYLLKKSPELKRLVNFDALLLAICWHDVWKSFHYAQNAFSFVYQTFAEGICAANLFRKRAREFKINRSLIKKVFFLIRKHSVIQILPTSDLDVQVLWDLDEFEMWNIDRIKRGMDTFFINKKSLYRKLEKLFYQVLYLRKPNFVVMEDLLEKRRKEFMRHFR